MTTSSNEEGTPPRGQKKARRVRRLAIAGLAVSFLLILPQVSRAAAATSPSLMWSKPKSVDGKHPLLNVSCAPSSSLCVAADLDGHVVTTKNPVTSTWTSADIDGSKKFYGVSCPKVSLCVAVDDDGHVLTSTTPTVSSSWKKTDINGSDALDTVSCAVAPSTVCVAFGEGKMFVSTDPAAATTSVWKKYTWDAYEINAVSCPKSSLCVAVDDDGNTYVSTNPIDAEWKYSLETDDGDYLTSVSCVTAPSDLCVATDDTGDVLTSLDPSGDKWSSKVIDADNGSSGSSFIEDMSCVNPTFCVGVDNVGDVVKSSHPTGGYSDWKIAEVEPKTCVEVCGPVGNGIAIYGVSCPSSSMCVASDSGGNVITGTAPTPVRVSHSGVGYRR
jgi:hypothetical protein